MDFGKLPGRIIWIERPIGIVPPSIPVVLFAVVAQESVGQLFLGGAIPGLMIGVFQLVLVTVMARRRGFPREDVRPSIGVVIRETALSLLEHPSRRAVGFWLCTASAVCDQAEPANRCQRQWQRARQRHGRHRRSR